MYKELLEGKEIAIVNFSELSKVIDYRIEAEYFAHKFLEIDKAISKTKTISFTEIATFVNGRPYNSDCFNCIDGVYVSKIGDVTNRREISEWEYVTIEEFREQKGKFLINGDILMTLTGDPPDVGKVNYIFNPHNASWNQRVAKIRIKTKQNYYRSNEVLYAVLSTDFSRKQLERYAKGIRQRNLGNESLDRLRIPILSDETQKAIESFVESSYQSLSKSHILYQDAETQFLEELGLKDWQPSNNPFNIKQLKESFLTSGRLDAEHYQLKYDELESMIKSVPFKTITEIQQFNARGVQPEYVQDGEVSVVNSKHILEDGLDYDNFEHTTTAFLNSHKRAQIGYGDILIYTTGANIGRTQAYLKDEPAVASNHVNILRVQGLNPIYLAMVLNSQVGRLQAEKLCTGSAQAELYPSDIEKFMVPILDKTIQDTISAKIQESFALKAESKRLLEEAKMMVEREIENGGE